MEGWLPSKNDGLCHLRILTAIEDDLGELILKKTIQFNYQR